MLKIESKKFSFVLSGSLVLSQSARTTGRMTFSKVRRMGNAHSHARITKRMASHKAGMRASCDSIETAFLPLSVFIVVFEGHRGVAPVPLRTF